MNLPRVRLNAALQTSDPSRAARELACMLRNEGMGQIALYRLFDDFRAFHEHDVEESRYEAVLDAMDIISGHCGPSFRLFDTELSDDVI